MIVLHDINFHDDGGPHFTIRFVSDTERASVYHVFTVEDVIRLDSGRLRALMEYLGVGGGPDEVWEALQARVPGPQQPSSGSFQLILQDEAGNALLSDQLPRGVPYFTVEVQLDSESGPQTIRLTFERRPLRT